MSEYFIYYSESNAACLIIFGIMLFRDLYNADKQEKQVKYDRALLSFMGYFASDIFWAGIIAGFIPKNYFTVITANLLNYIFMAGLTYSWLVYVMAYEHVRNRDSKKTKFTLIFPVAAATVAIIFMLIFTPRVLFDENLNITLTFSVLQVTVPIIYIIAVLVYAIRKARKDINPSDKRNDLFIGTFPLTVVFGGLMQMLFLPRIPIFCFISTIFMLIIYIRSIDRQISTDPLTGLNNRGQLARYVAAEDNFRAADRSTFIIMLDVNDFKKINDTFGHSEGDRALVIIADSLRYFAHNHSIPSFLCRYGGDEFMIIIHPTTVCEVAPLIEEIRRNVADKCVSENAPYIISVGIGFDEYIVGTDTFQQCVLRADEKLYADKKRSKSNGRSTVIKQYEQK